MQNSEHPLKEVIQFNPDLVSYECKNCGRDLEGPGKCPSCGTTYVALDKDKPNQEQVKNKENNQSSCAVIEQKLRGLSNEKRTAIANGDFYILRDTVKDMITSSELADVYYFGGVTNEQGGFISTQEGMKDPDFKFQGEVSVSDDEGSVSEKFSIFKMEVKGENYLYYTVEKSSGLSEFKDRIMKSFRSLRNPQ